MDLNEKENSSYMVLWVKIRSFPGPRHEKRFSKFDSRYKRKRWLTDFVHIKTKPQVSQKRIFTMLQNQKSSKTCQRNDQIIYPPLIKHFEVIVKSRKRCSALLTSLLIQLEKLNVIAKYQMVQKFSMLGCITYGNSFFCWVERELRFIRKDIGHPHMKIKINKCKEPNTLNKEQSQTQPLSMQDCNAICFWVQIKRMQTNTHSLSRYFKKFYWKINNIAQSLYV